MRRSFALLLAVCGLSGAPVACGRDGGSEGEARQVGEATEAAAGGSAVAGGSMAAGGDTAAGGAAGAGGGLVAPPAEQLAAVQRGSAEEVVRLLLQWDTAGLRFEGTYADALAGLYCFEPEQQCVSDEPAWDFAVVVAGYQLDPVFVSADSAQYVVLFDELGAVWPDGTSDPLGAPPATISLRRMDDKWRVVGVQSQLPPHLSPNGLLRRYRGIQPDSAVLARWLRDRQ